MTTTERPTATPCPVAWCESAGHHRYEDELGDPTRIWHDRSCSKSFTSEVFLGGPAVLLDCYENEEGKVFGPDIDVEVTDITQPEELTILIRLLMDAGDTAWPGFTASFTYDLLLDKMGGR